MSRNIPILHNIWDDWSDFATGGVQSAGITLEELMSNIFTAGPSYHYVIDFEARALQFVSPSIRAVLGLNPDTVVFNDIIERVHPDDIDFVAAAESAIMEVLHQQPALQHSCKTSFCFRFRMPDGGYHMFHHQAVLLSPNASGRYWTALNIHTDIAHLTTTNNYKAHLMDVRNNNAVLTLEVPSFGIPAAIPCVFTRREREIVRLLSKGLVNKQIADELSIALHTVLTHRKNIMQKAEAKSPAELMAKCLENGWV
ncbi:LuxR C-terminal-related transcriptional regulator [Chitinophaga lutea]